MHDPREHGPERENEKDDLSEGSLPAGPTHPNGSEQIVEAEIIEEAEAPRLSRRQWLTLGISTLVAGGAGALIYKAASAIDFAERRRIAITELLVTGATGRDMTPIVEGLSPELKKAVAEHFVAEIKDGGLPGSYWQLNAKIISLLDPSTYQSEFRKESVERYRESLKELDVWRRSPGDEKLMALDGSVRQIHQSMAFVPEDARLLGEAKIHSYERELLTKHKELVRPYVDRLVERIRRREILMSSMSSSALAEADILASFREDIESSGLFRKAEGRYLYQHTSEEGHVSEWTLESRSPALEFAMTLRNKAVPEKLVSMEAEEFFERVTDGRGFADLIAKAEEHYASEQAGLADLCAYDFPEEGPISYVRVFPRYSDSVVSTDLFPSMMRACALEERYGERLRISPVLHTDDPLTSIREELKRQRRGADKPSFFVLDVSNHGEPGYLGFSKELTAEGLATLAREMPDCKFAIRSFACFGGGLRNGFLEVMKKEPELKDRIDVFVQTKPDLYNRITLVSGSAYDAFLVKNLFDEDIPTFGTAVMMADLETKLLTELDPESIIDGKLIAETEPDAGWRRELEGLCKERCQRV